MAQDTLEVSRRLREILNECCIEYVNNARKSGQFAPSQITALKKHLTSLSQYFFEECRTRIVAADSLNVGQLPKQPTLDAELAALEELFRTRSSELILLRECVPEHVAAKYNETAQSYVPDDLIQQFERLRAQQLEMEEQETAKSDQETSENAGTAKEETDHASMAAATSAPSAADETLSRRPLLTAEALRRLILTRAEVAAALTELVEALPTHTESTRNLNTVLVSSLPQGSATHSGEVASMPGSAGAGNNMNSSGGGVSRPFG